MASQCSSAGSAEPAHRLRDKRILPRYGSYDNEQGYRALAYWVLGHHPSDEHHVCGRHASEHFRTRGSLQACKPLTDIWQEILETLNHKSWLVLFFAGVVFSIYVGLTTGLGIYFNRFFWDWTPSDIAIFAIADLSAALVISVFAGVNLPRFWDKKRLATWLFIVSHRRRQKFCSFNAGYNM